MIIQCGSCQTRYHYDETRFGSAVVKKIRCTKCSTVFEIKNPNVSDGPERSSLLLADDFTLDPTEMASEPRRRPTPTVPPPLPPGVAQSQISDADQMVSTMRRDSVSIPAPPSRPIPAPKRDSQSTGEFPPVGSGERPLKLPDWFRLSLACIAGPDSGRIFEIDKPKVTIGRANADVILSDTQCSRQHAVIEVMDDEAYIVDLGSTNGTFVGDKRITRHALDNRTEFDVGATTLMFIKTRKEG